MSDTDAIEFVTLHARLAELVAEVARVDLAEASQLIRYAIQMAEVSAAAVVHDGSKGAALLRDFGELPSPARVFDDLQEKYKEATLEGRTEDAKKIRESIASLSKRVEDAWAIAIDGREAIDDLRWAFPSTAQEQTPPR